MSCLICRSVHMQARGCRCVAGFTHIVVEQDNLPGKRTRGPSSGIISIDVSHEGMNSRSVRLEPLGRSSYIICG